MLTQFTDAYMRHWGEDIWEMSWYRTNNDTGPGKIINTGCAPSFRNISSAILNNLLNENPLSVSALEALQT